MSNSQSKEFRTPSEAVQAPERSLTVHELEAVKRQSSLILAYLVLLKSNPEAVAGELRPTFPEQVAEQPPVEQIAELTQQPPQDSKSAYELAA